MVEDAAPHDVPLDDGRTGGARPRDGDDRAPHRPRGTAAAPAGEPLAPPRRACSVRSAPTARRPALRTDGAGPSPAARCAGPVGARFGWSTSRVPAGGRGAAAAGGRWAGRSGAGVDEVQAQRGCSSPTRASAWCSRSLRPPRAARAPRAPGLRLARPPGLAAPGARCSSSRACRPWTPSPAASSCRASSPTGSTSASASVPEALGALFFGTNLLSALSFLVATRVADGSAC